MNEPDAELRRRTTASGQPASNSVGETPGAATMPDAEPGRGVAAGWGAVPVVHNYGSSAEYAEAVRAWLWAYHSWQLTQCMMPMWLQNINSQNSMNYAAIVQRTDSIPSQQRPVQIQTGTLTGVRHTIPSFGRRVVAELVDSALCFMISLFVTFVLVELGVLNLEKYEKLLNNEADLKTFIDITQDLFPLEILKRLVTSFIEALYISKGIGPIPPGRTPGKMLMGLKVVPCVNIHPVSLRDHSVSVESAVQNISYANALVRSTMKNFALGFLFPLCVVMFTFRFNRSIYDLVAKTVVVED